MKRSYAVGNLVNILLKSTEVINRKNRLVQSTQIVRFASQDETN